MKILVTGSRKWVDERFICAVLNNFRDKNPKANPKTVVLMHGACPDGADAIADAYGEDVGWTVIRYPAQWRVHDENCPPSHQGQPICKKAGYRRNAEMVALGADLCLAFIRDGSPGSTMCADLAVRAGIETYVYAWDSSRTSIDVTLFNRREL